MSKETLSITKEIPKHNNALEEKYKNVKEKEPLNPETIEAQKSQLPEPSGWRLLVLPFTPKEKSKGGVIFTQESLDKIRISTNCGYVIKLGPLAYNDKEKYPTGPWCKKGDWVIFARYAGSRIEIDGGEVRLLNDDEILATVQDPTDILHKF